MRPHPHRPPLVESALAALEALAQAGRVRQVVVTVLYPVPTMATRAQQERGDFSETLSFEIPREHAWARDAKAAAPPADGA